MLLSLTGASGAGKSTLLAMLAEIDWGHPLACVEFDSIGVPEGADTSWRHGAIEHWVQRALAEQEAGGHLLLCGQVPIGELLAAPSADQLDGIAMCVLHCSLAVRRERLRERGVPEGEIVHHVRFGEWFLGHSLDPAHHPEVIRVDSPVPMRWERWKQGDLRWSPRIIDTDAATPEQTARLVESWVRECLDGEFSTEPG